MAGTVGVVAQKSAKEKIDEAISFGTQTALLTPQDVQIAQQSRALSDDRDKNEKGKLPRRKPNLDHTEEIDERAVLPRAA